MQFQFLSFVRAHEPLESLNRLQVCHLIDQSATAFNLPVEPKTNITHGIPDIPPGELDKCYVVPRAMTRYSNGSPCDACGIFFSSLSHRSASASSRRSSTVGDTRMHTGTSFSYWDAEGKRITNKDMVRRIKSIGIPPAYEKVWICPSANGQSGQPASSPRAQAVSLPREMAGAARPEQI